MNMIIVLCYSPYNIIVIVIILFFRFGHLEVVKYLVEAQGCIAGSVDGVGCTPLHFACV